MTTRRHTMRPVIVEVKPDNAETIKSTSRSRSPSVPPTPPSPKAVRFAETPDKTSRPLTSTEAWSIYHFELHARQCSHCYKPYDVHKRGHRLCDTGHGLAQDVAEHVFRRGDDGEIYSTKRDNARLVRVEVPYAYVHLRGLLKSLERGIRSHHQRTIPIISSYERPYPVSSRRSYEPSGEPEAVIIQPASSTDHQSRRRSKHKSAGYPTIVINNIDRADDSDDLATIPSISKERRGTLYEKDKQRKEKNYRVEIREPSHPRSGEHRRSGIWL